MRFICGGDRPAFFFRLFFSDTFFLRIFALKMKMEDEAPLRIAFFVKLKMGK